MYNTEKATIIPVPLPYLLKEVIVIARPPKIYFIAKRAKSWREVQHYLNSVVFQDANNPIVEHEHRLALRRYAVAVYLQFHRPQHYIRRKKGLTRQPFNKEM